MFERFTPPARRVLVLAQDQARSVGHGFIDTEHLLLGLLGEDQGTASQALGAAGVDAGAVRAAMAATMGPVSTDTQGPLAAGNAGSAPGSVGFSPLARQALELSLRQALALRHGFIGTEHLLLGLLQQGQSGALYLLRQQGVDPARLRAEVLRRLEEAGHPVPRRVPRITPQRAPLAWPRPGRRRQWPGP